MYQPRTFIILESLYGEAYVDAILQEGIGSWLAGKALPLALAGMATLGGTAGQARGADLPAFPPRGPQTTAQKAQQRLATDVAQRKAGAQRMLRTVTHGKPLASAQKGERVDRAAEVERTGARDVAGPGSAAMRSTRYRYVPQAQRKAAQAQRKAAQTGQKAQAKGKDVTQATVMRARIDRALRGR